jgi:hypothetical protein
MTTEEKQDMILKRMRDNYKPHCVRIIRPVDRLIENQVYDVNRCAKNGMVLEVFITLMIEGDEFLIEVYPDEFEILSWIWCGSIPKAMENSKWRTTIVRRRPRVN